MITNLKKAVRVLGAVELAVSVALLLLIVASIAADVFSRTLLSTSLIWVQEAATISFIWVTFLGAAVASKMDRHVAIATYGSFISPHAAMILDALISVFVFCVSFAISIFVIGYIPVQNRSITISLPINFPRGWVFAIPTLIAMASIAITQLVRVMDIAVHLRGGAGSTRGPLMEMAE